MKTRSVLTAGQFTDADYEAAKNEPVILASARLGQLAGAPLRLAGPPPARRDPVRRGARRHVREGRHRRLQGHRRRSTGRCRRRPRSGSRRPPSPRTGRTLPAYLQSINVSDSSWIRNLKGRGIYNAALGGRRLPDRPDHGLRRQRVYYEKAHGKKFQPQYDVLGDGWRQPGSAFKPINYLDGIEDHTMTAATMFMDVVTTSAAAGRRATPTSHERGPLRLRQAIQISLNIPAIKAAPISGPDHVFDVAQQIRHPVPVDEEPGRWSIGIGTLELHFDRPHQRLWRDRQRRRAHAADGHPQDRGRRRQGRLAGRRQMPRRARRSSARRPPSSCTDILQSNTDPHSNPFWSRLRHYAAASAGRPP